MADEIAIKAPKNYPLRGAIILFIAHTVFIVFLLLWTLEKSIFTSSGGNFILYLIEFPGVVITKAIGQAESLEVIAPYAITFFINTVFYTLIGFGLGSLFYELGWVDETDNLFLTEDELMEKDQKEHEA